MSDSQDKLSEEDFKDPVIEDLLINAALLPELSLIHI